MNQTSYIAVALWGRRHFPLPSLADSLTPHNTKTTHEPQTSPTFLFRNRLARATYKRCRTPQLLRSANKLAHPLAVAKRRTCCLWRCSGLSYDPQVACQSCCVGAELEIRRSRGNSFWRKRHRARRLWMPSIACLGAGLACL
jgi:hypothetical protein